MLQVCRICLHYIITDEDFFEIDNNEGVMAKIKSVIPEMNMKNCRNSVICKKCHDALEAAFQFKSTCLKTDDIIDKQLKKRRTQFADFDLKLVALVNTGVHIGNNTKIIEVTKEITEGIKEEIIEISDEDNSKTNLKNEMKLPRKKTILKLCLKLNPIQPKNKLKKKRNLVNNEIKLPKIVNVTSLKKSETIRENVGGEHFKLFSEQCSNQTSLQTHEEISSAGNIEIKTEPKEEEDFEVPIKKPQKQHHACKHCSKKFPSARGLKYHLNHYCENKMILKNKIKRYRCSGCKKAASFTQGEYICPNCDGIKFNNFSSYKWHMKYIHLDEPYHCKNCKAGFSTKRDLLNHSCTKEECKKCLWVVNNIKGFQCRLCIRFFSDYEEFKKHAEATHESNNLCKFCFNTIKSERHRCTYMCSLCEKLFKDIKSLETHTH